MPLPSENKIEVNVFVGQFICISISKVAIILNRSIATTITFIMIQLLANENSYDKNPDKPIVVGGVVFPEQVYSI